MDRSQRRHWREQVFGHADLTTAQKLTLLALETFADYPEGTNARPGVTALAAMCGLGKRVVEGALQAGRDLKLIEQTGRANPKRNQAAVYRLLSTRTDMRIEGGSTRTDMRLESGFNPHEPTFQPARTDVSTRTLMQPTNPEHQAKAPSSDGTHAVTIESVAAELLEKLDVAQQPRQITERLRKQIVRLLAEGMDPGILAEALDRWERRPDAGPGLLPDLYSDALKARRSSDQRAAAAAGRDPSPACPDCSGTRYVFRDVDSDSDKVDPCPRCNPAERTS